MSEQLVNHTGGCHCGAVRFQVEAPTRLTALECNCSICVKKQTKSFIVPASRFKILQGEENLTTYTFNTGEAKHMFCKTCGVQSFYVPRGCPNDRGIVLHCLDVGTVESTSVMKFDGKNFEEAIKLFQDA